ncbi:Speckle-type POZ protein [Araneus ventricosus]|uniref:Speckle-type POZ protein n=1 Tax=Araneus ventricosus TaxID=182803 RepID=A0A4Y2NZR3_ARAVE|nr:Speckle-type POZ protein [Araneus ventricosus]
MGGTNFNLILCPNSVNFKDSIACCVQRQSKDDLRLELDYELSFLSGDGSALHSEMFLKNVHKMGEVHTSPTLHVKRDEVFLHKKGLFIPDDTFTVRCRMWGDQISFSEQGCCFAETQIEPEYVFFVGTIENFDNLEPRKKYPVRTMLSPKKFTMSLCVAADGKIDIEIKPLCEIKNLYKCKIFILDRFENEVKSGEGEFHDEKPYCIPLNISKEYLLKKYEYYLLKNVLTIRCEAFIYSEKITHKREYIFGCQHTQEMISNARHTEGFLCDTKLKTATETFPSHIAVLSARSPVFKSMFTTEMKEKTNKCVVIDDLDAHTVRQMLLFMYSDTLDDLAYESAKSLYFAADKYSIISLRHRCAGFLKQIILLTNCCDILLLADRHQDNDLKNAVQDYIAKNDELVLFSDEFKNLEKNHPQLTTDVFRAVYMKIRRS